VACWHAPSAAVQKEIQRVLKNKGVYTGDVDGEWLTLSNRAIQQVLTNWGYYTGPVDGVPGVNTCIGVQKYAKNPGGWTGAVTTTGTLNADAWNKFLAGLNKGAGVNPPVTQVDAGDHHACAVLSTGSVKCWGYNPRGELGNGTKTSSRVPVTVKGISNATAVAAGYSHTCALIAGGTVKCWGGNEVGQLGNGTNTDSTTPVAVKGISNAKSISAGHAHTCVLLKDGSVTCWGFNLNGQLGNGKKVSSTVPVATTAIGSSDYVLEIDAGYSHTCALLRYGTANIKCWGDDIDGVVRNAAAIKQAWGVSSGRYYSCALVDLGTVKCWGQNVDYEQGNGSVKTAVSIATGYGHTCALASDNTVRCWGSNNYGQLGNGKYSAATGFPSTVTGISTAKGITVGDAYACALLSGGTVKCWGRNMEGQLGSGSSAATSNVPVGVKGLS